MAINIHSAAVSDTKSFTALGRIHYSLVDHKAYYASTSMRSWLCTLMGGPSEREYREKLGKILDNTNKGARDVHEKFAHIQKIKVDALKKTEEMKRSADREIDKTMIEITKSQDLAIESKERLQTEISSLRNRIEQIYTDLKKRISETMVPGQTAPGTYP